ncbi:MAG TPA: CPBP family intramembrane glutamic endopeptidase [Burkholderiaceae bacterium]|nr:CPBP family intramembrane glutamic endopeptidase [Burkholderiaceae bacterium]
MLAFSVLALAVASAWLPDIRLSRRIVIAPWWLGLGAAIVVAMVEGVVRTPALLGLALLSVSAWAATRGRARAWWTVIAVVVALALALHIWPGFESWVVIERARLSADAPPFTYHARFDKGAAGLLLLVFLTRRAATVTQWPYAFNRQSMVVLACTVATVIGLGLALGYVRPDPKWPAMAPAFLVFNLLLTCVAEEAFFRGVLQERCAAFVHARWGARWPALLVTSVVFGAAHGAGGVALVVLATVASIGYGLAYETTRRIEPAIATHFCVNAAHFLGFTYPVLARAV